MVFSIQIGEYLSFDDDNMNSRGVNEPSCSLKDMFANISKNFFVQQNQTISDHKRERSPKIGLVDTFNESISLV